MRVLVSGATAVVLAVLAGPVIAGGMDAPDTDASVVSESDAGADAGQQDGSDASVPGDAGDGDGPYDDQPTERVTGFVDEDGGDGSGGDGSGGAVVVDDCAGTDDVKDEPVEYVSTGPIEDDTLVITITSEPQETSGLLQDSATTEVSALPAPDAGSSCAYVPERRGVVCD